MIDNIGIKLEDDETNSDGGTEIGYLRSIHNVYNVIFGNTPRFYFQGKKLKVTKFAYNIKRDYLASLLEAVQCVEISRTKRAVSST